MSLEEEYGPRLYQAMQDTGNLKAAVHLIGFLQTFSFPCDELPSIEHRVRRADTVVRAYAYGRRLPWPPPGGLLLFMAKEPAP